MRIFIYLIFQFVFFTVFGQNPSSRLMFNYLTIEEGLPNNKVNSINMDDRGFVWVATNDGIARFDGLEVKSYSLTDYSLSANQVRTGLVNKIMIDEGKILVGAYSLFYYNKISDKFENYPFRNETVPLKRIRTMEKDEKNTIWIGDQTGLYSIEASDKDSLLFYPYTQSGSIDINSILPLGDSLLIGTRNLGMLWFDVKEKKFSQFLPFYDIQNKNIALCLFEENGTIWAGTNNNGIFKINLEDNQVDHLYLVSEYDISNRIRDILKNTDGNIWIGSRGGLFVQEANSNEIKLCAESNHPYSKLSSNSIYDIFIDKDQSIWLGTFSGGVNYANLKRKPFGHFSAQQKGPNFLSNNIISCFYEDKNGNIYIGTDSGGLNYLNREKEEFTYYVHNSNDPNSISNDGINAIIGEVSGNIWIATSAGGLNYFNPNTQTFKYFMHDPDDPSSINNNNINSLVVDKDQNLWIASSTGIDFLPHGQTIFQHKYVGAIDFLYQSKDGRLWAGMSGNGIYYYNTLTDAFESFFGEFINSSVRSMLIDSENNLWSGGNKGIVFVNTTDSTSYYYSTLNGLPTNLIMGIQEDEQKNLWVSTSSGLLKCEGAISQPSNLSFRKYSLADGIQSNQFYPYSYLKSTKNELFFGGINGFNVFYPEQIKENNIPPKLAFTGLKLFNKPVQVGQEIEGKVILTKPLDETQNIDLSYKHRVVTFDFVALHYANPKQNIYRYKLSPLEKDWNYTTAERSDATYTNLDGGDYTFEVEAANSDGFWSKDQLKLSIKVSPPFWQTPWFILMSILLLVLVIVSYYLYRITALKRYSSVLENEVSARTEEVRKSKTLIEDDYQRFMLLSDFGNKITSTLDQKSILSMVSEYVNVLINVDYLGIGKVDLNKQKIIYPSTRMGDKDYESFSISLNEKDNCAVDCLNKQAPIYSNNIPTDYPELIETIKKVSNIAPGSLICIPLTVENEKIGVLTVFNEKRSTFNEKHITLLQTLSYYVAIALSNSNTYAALSNQTKVLSEMNTELVNRQLFIEKQQEELIQQKEALQELNLMKDKFFSIIAHDLKSPFQALLGFTSVLENEYHSTKDETRQTYIGYISNSAQNIFNLLTNLLTWSQSQTSKIESDPMVFNLREEVNQTIELLSNNSGNKSIFVRNEVNSSIQVNADKNMTETILRNIISNAIKFTPAKGEVSISAEKMESIVRVAIKDSGIGITEADMKNLFKIDKSISRAGTSGESGTGLGLLICKEFVEKNGGEISVESNLNRGTTFYFTLKSAN